MFMHGSQSAFGHYGHHLYYEINGKRLLFDGQTGLLEYDISEDNPDVLARLNKLAQSDPSTSADPFMNAEIGELKPITGLFTIYLSSACNMSCSYCQNSGGSMGRAKENMKSETARRVVPFLENHLKYSHKKSVGINLFGGEPMLNPGALLDIMEAFASWQDDESKDFRVQLFTNGTIYHKEVVEAIKRLGENIVVTVSLDGSPERHNTHRRFTNGMNSWDMTYGFTQRLREEGVPFSIATVVPYPYDHKEMAEELIALGFDTFEIKDIVPISYGGMGSAEALRPDYALWRQKYLEYNEFCLDLFRKGSKILPVDRLHLMSLYKLCYRRSPNLLCGLVMKKAAIDTRGDIYPCEFFIHSDFVLGNVHEGWNAEKLGCFAKVLNAEGLMKVNKPECMSCFAKHLCDGGCYAMSWERTGKLNEIRPERCEYFRERIKIDLYYMSEMRSLEAELSAGGLSTPSGNDRLQ
jgi:uncharacterized protein